MGMASKTTPSPNAMEEELAIAKVRRLGRSSNVSLVQDSNKDPEDSDIADSDLELKLEEPSSLELPGSDIYNKKKQILSLHA
ncbi:hypothetical protein TB1_034071 [Malus domestica]